ncbi:MAG: hypothetical protein MRY83_03755 [Flavobacteriales bacterium]|nr:hypothetical protein [Flavobacteriales bacterium]
MIGGEKRMACLLLLATLLNTAKAQGVFENQYWKDIRKEIIFGVGGSNFLGELGGKDQVGTDYINDLEFLATRFVFQTGFRFFVFKQLSVKTGLFYGRLYGNDAFTTEPFRQNRNLHFRSDIVELSPVIEYHFLTEKQGNKYKIRGMKVKEFEVGIYTFAGVGMYWNNPKAEYLDGKWYNLRKLRTGGQGLPGGPDEYKSTGVAIPMGFGLRYSIARFWRIDLEVGWRKTFSDYLDDASGNYYDPEIIEEEVGTIAAHFADPNLGHQLHSGCQTCAGQPRGDGNDYDSYVFGTVDVCYKIHRKPGFRRFKVRRRVIEL